MAVVDVETTGLYNNDRIVEIAIVTVSPSGEVIDEFDTLINPERDVGPTHIHGVTAAMVSSAPTFDEVSAAIANHLEGKTLTCHNVAFDLRMLTNEFTRINESIAAGQTVCTLSATGARLKTACDARGIRLDNAHRALSDARATASLASLLSLWSEGAGVTTSLAGVSGDVRTQRREAGFEPNNSPLRRVVQAIHYPQAQSRTLSYFAALDWALDDSVLDLEEEQYLGAVASYLGMSPADVSGAHQSYMDALVFACERDHVITNEEHYQMVSVATALRLDVDIPAATELASFDPAIAESVVRVCFTGAATLPDGRELTRAVLHELGQQHGFEPVASVTKKSCDLLVAADVATASGKAAKARKWGIPVISVEAFIETHCN